MCIYNLMKRVVVSEQVMCIYGKMKQSQRTDIFYQFNAAKSGVLLCTDIAARGLDIPEVCVGTMCFMSFL